MQTKIKWLLLGLFPFFTYADPPLKNPHLLKLNTLYNSLDPTSISQQFAFYELYPHTSYGDKALNQVWNLFQMHKSHKTSAIEKFSLPPVDLMNLIAFVNKQPYEQRVALTHEQISIINSLASHLSNRKLKGSVATTKEEILSLPSEEIDLARALLIYEYEKDPDPLFAIKQYEASLDLMALQILARLPAKATSIEKIDAISHYIFHEMQYRFPPQSVGIKDIDVYTVLPAVLDSRKGVCLGVSILYLTLAQRLDLQLEIITPPGHIYVRYHEGDTMINIETTARGIHIPTEHYLGINTYRLLPRTMKEVIGMSFLNQASVLWGKNDYETTIELYEKARPYLANDPTLKMLLGIQYVLVDDLEKGYPLLRDIAGKPFPDSIYQETIPEDILKWHISKEALASVFLHVSETRESILAKKEKLTEAVKAYPKFRAAVLQLAICWLQLGRSQEGLAILKNYHELDKNDPTVNYYLTALCLQRLRYKEAWDYLFLAKTLLDEKHHFPKALQSLQYQLRLLDSEYVHKNCNLL